MHCTGVNMKSIILKSRLYFVMIFIFLITTKEFGQNQPKYDAYVFGFLFTKITVWLFKGRCICRYLTF